MAKHRADDDARHHFGGQRGTSRRTALLVIGSGGAAAWAIGLYANSATAVSSDSVEAAVAEYFQARANAANSRRTGRLTARLDRANRSLLQHETERSQYLASLGSASRWNGRIGRFGTSPGILSTKISGSAATVRAYEELKVSWYPAPLQRPVAMRPLVEQDPQKYGLDQSANQPVLSAIGVAHELTLGRGSAGWVVTSDAYQEDLFLGRSPDAPRSPWAVSMNTTRPNAGLRTQGVDPGDEGAPVLKVTAAAAAEPLMMAAATTRRSYSWQKAVAYAAKHWSSYNPAYPNYNPCGGDCANFVSQCLRAGGETTDGTWYTYRGSGCIRSSGNCGSTAWVNNWGLRNWTVNKRRGRVVSNIWQLGRGDIVNYDWTGNGSFDHVAIVTNSASMLVTAHNTNHYNVPWSMGARRHSLTWILGHF